MPNMAVARSALAPRGPVAELLELPATPMTNHLRSQLAVRGCL